MLNKPAEKKGDLPIYRETDKKAISAGFALYPIAKE
jgi:hypothetical protein